MKVKNELTGKMIDLNKAVLTTDEKWISSEMYSEVLMYLKKSSASLTEIKRALKDEDEFFLDIASYLLLIRRYSAKNNQKLKFTVRQFIKYEEEESILKYKKEYTLLTKEEHLSIVDILIEKYLGDIKVTDKPNEHHTPEYIWGMYNVNRFHLEVVLR